MNKDKIILFVVSGVLLIVLGTMMVLGTININADGSATLTFTIPSGSTVKAQKCFTENYGYQDYIINVDTGEETPNPMSKSAFVNQVFINFYKETMRSCEARWYQEEYNEPYIERMT